MHPLCFDIQSRKELYAEERQYLSVEENSDIYKLVPLGIASRVRAIELLACLAHDGAETCIEWLDEYIAELRKVLRTATSEIPESVARKLKQVV
jgi:hypothetical protein